MTKEYGEEQLAISNRIKEKYSDWSEFFNKAVLYDIALDNCMAKGIVSGYPDLTIGGERNLTRAEAAAIIARVKYEENRLGDFSTKTARDAWINAQLEECIEPGMTDREKAVAIAEHLCDYLYYSLVGENDDFGEYDETVDIANKRVVCQGYASKYYWLCKFAGLEVEAVIPTGNHMWNRVKIDGEWYHIDVTGMDGYPTDDIYYGYSLSKEIWPKHVEDYGAEKDYIYVDGITDDLGIIPYL